MVLRVIYAQDEDGERIAFAFLLMPDLPEGVELVFEEPCETQPCEDATLVN